MSHNDGSEIDISQEVRQSLIGLDPNSRYAIRVRSIDGLGNKSEWSEAMEFETSPGAAGRPIVPSGVTADWTESDIEVSWNPVSTSEDGNFIDVSNYEFVVGQSDVGGFMTAKRYPVYGLNFKYSRANQLADLTPYRSDSDSIHFVAYWVTAVSRGGIRSKEPSLADSLGLGIHAVTHYTADPTIAPRVQDIGNRVLVTMDQVHDCTDAYKVYLSTDGGSSWTLTATSSANTYVYTPSSDGTYYFKYSVHDSVTDEESAYSPVSYVDYVAGGGVSDHGDLSGLGDDDHTQYALADGSRGAFATEAQGSLADSAVQPGDLGTAATADSTDFATAIQGATADTAVQPGDLGTAATADTGDFDAAGTATSAVSGHEGSPDPHTQYHNDTRGDARYALSSHTHSAYEQGSFSVPIDGPGSSTTGTWLSSVSFGYPQVVNTTSANGDAKTYNYLAGTGTYTLTVVYLATTAGPKIQFAVNGSNVGSLYDTYSGSTTLVTQQITGLTLSDFNTFGFTINGRNASNVSGYTFRILKAQFTRTA